MALVDMLFNRVQSFLPESIDYLVASVWALNMMVQLKNFNLSLENKVKLVRALPNIIIEGNQFSQVPALLFSLTGIFTYEDFKDRNLYADLYEYTVQKSHSYLVSGEKLNVTNLSTLMMGWAKVRVIDTKLLTFASVTLLEDEFYESANSQDLCNLL
jgi:hypothetical protein